MKTSCNYSLHFLLLLLFHPKNVRLEKDFLHLHEPLELIQENLIEKSLWKGKQIYLFI